MARYQIIDEPTGSSWGERLIMDPTLILFICIFVPIFIPLPAMGRFWIPLVWFSLNGLALGSATLRRELIALWLGSVMVAVLYFVIVTIAVRYSIDTERLTPYLRIMVFAGIFTVLYIASFNQQKSYDLFNYLRSNRL